MAYKFKFKARPKSRRPRFGGSGSPSKRTRGGSMSRLKRKKEEAAAKKKAEEDAAKKKTKEAVDKKLTDKSENNKKQKWHHSNAAGTSEKKKTMREAKNLEKGYDKDGSIEGAGGYGLEAPKKFKSKEEQTKAEKEAEDNVNRRLAAKEKAAKEKANKKKTTKFFNVSYPMYGGN